MEVLELCVLGLEVFLSAVLCFWFIKEKRDKSPWSSTCKLFSRNFQWRKLKVTLLSICRRLWNCMLKKKLSNENVLLLLYMKCGFLLHLCSLKIKNKNPCWVVAHVWCLARTADTWVVVSTCQGFACEGKTTLHTSQTLHPLYNGSVGQRCAAVSICNSVCGFTLTLFYRWKYLLLAFSCIHTLSLSDRKLHWIVKRFGK